ncbi:aldo/keto reductase [Lapidilactobacillus mulanensis]|uniref:Aldo/keto reductase n=1 Tax=Lapidilactobacillus mulanensis TaxID=2485999 RepID=A0ABW4DP12_9LACO|nr:aldo/keto reductase [Lapidilactobacillus mulanensis]
MSTLFDTYTLENGLRIPVMGLGTSGMSDEIAAKSVETAIKIGYRLIDTAADYHNEVGVGRGVLSAGLSRDEIFITSKLSNDVRGYDDTVAAVDQSIKNLQCDYLDLYLIHWPKPVAFRNNWEKANADSWRALEDLYHQGRIKSIGVSNFHIPHLEALAKTQLVAPMINQLFLAPGELQEDVVAYCRDHNIIPEAYSPLGAGKVFKVKELKKIADNHGKTIAQVALRWSLVHNFIPIPKSKDEARMRENADIFDFKLTPDEIEIIDSLDGVAGRTTDPDSLTV